MLSTFVLIHGGGGSSWDWSLLEPELRERGHDVVAVDLPIEDESAGLAEFTDTVVEAVGDRTNLVVVAHSYGGFTGPLVCARLPVKLLVMLAAMIPAPGEKPGDWWVNTGHQAPEGLSETEQFFNGVPPEVAIECVAHGRSQVSAEWSQPWPLDAWPGVPTKVLIAAQDQFFTPEFQRRVAKERLNVVPDEIEGGHSVPLGNPKVLADRLESYLAG